MAPRELVRQHGIFMMLLLVLSLAFGSRPCMMLGQADPALPSNHDCCPEPFATSDRPDNPAPLPCPDGPCWQAIGTNDWANHHGAMASDSHQPSQPLVVTWQLPPDWSGGGQLFQFLAAETTGPPPAQRSRILRL